jgi:hypothetical protein
VRRRALPIVAALAALLSAPPVWAGALRFFGNGVAAPDLDRVKIPIDDPGDGLPGPPADVGASDFTIEWWMRASAAENGAAAVACGDNIDWIYGNILLDRDRYDQGRKFGVSIAGGRLVFGVSTDADERTVCGATDLLDDVWHHVAVQRELSGEMTIWVDGALDGSALGPAGDVSYPDDGIPCASCCPGGSCAGSDPFLVIGAEKHDAGASFPSYAGFVDEIRLSDVIRYAAPFAPPTSPFAADATTAALYHLDEGSGDLVTDSSGHPAGPSEGERRFGGSPAGPEWSASTPFGSPGDLDGDGKPNGSDECTALVPGRQRLARATLKLDGLDLPAGGQGLLLRGVFGTAGAFALAPHADGAHLYVEDGGGALLDVPIPAGLVGASPSTPCDPRDGWTVGGSAARPVYLYRNFSGFLDATCSVPAAGVAQVKLKATGGDVSVQVRLEDGSLALGLPPARLQATVGLAAPPAAGTASPAAEAGACGEAVWEPVAAAPPPPFCKSSPVAGAVKRLRCRTPS